MAGQLVLMGSGETTPTMVTPHQRIGRAAGPGGRVFLDTPYGFQENADELGEKISYYFSHNVGLPIQPASLRSFEAASDLQIEQVRAIVDDAALVFAGPGSPSYALANWRAAGLGELFQKRLRDGASLVLASAAACVAGKRTLPVYEVYKAGFAPWWLEGFDLLSVFGLPATVIPHYDNTEGGTHDTRFCYMGERRLSVLEQEMDVDEFIIGVDEHTGLVIDLETRVAQVIGRGGVTVRIHGREHEWPSGTAIGLEEITSTAARLAGQPAPPAGETSASGPASGASSQSPPDEAFANALAAGDGSAATAAVLAAETLAADGDEEARQKLRGLITRLGEVAQGGLVDRRDVVGPYVETLLHVRDRLRRRHEFDEADHVRVHLSEGGVEVRDTPDGVEWDLPER